MSSRNLDFGSGLVLSEKRSPPASFSFTSLSQVCGFIATIRSTPPRRPSQPLSQTRTSYHVGRPWMLDGKMLRGLTGTPMRRIAFAKSVLAEAEPEPLTLANLTTKSLSAASGFIGLLALAPVARASAPSLPRQKARGRAPPPRRKHLRIAA